MVIKKKIVSKLLPGQPLFYTSDVLRILEIKKERLRQWMKLGYIRASKTSTGSGVSNVFSEYEVYRIGLFKKLIDLGLNRWISSQYAWRWDHEDWEQIKHGNIKFMIAGGTPDRTKPDWEDSMKIAQARVSPAGFDDIEIALVVNLYKLVKQIQAKM